MSQTTTAADGGPPDPEALESKFTSSIRERLEEQKPSEERRRILRLEHQHHLVRDTTSQLQLDDDIDLEGVHAEARATIPDTYCFTCDGWIGLSGVNLRGRPRSRADAYYLGGPSEEVKRAREEAQDTLAELANSVLRTVPTVDDAEEACEFVSTELEKLTAAQK